jgi:thiamine biosynthesis protein ThiI
MDMGEFVLNNSNLTVKIKNPDYTIQIEVHEKSTYIFHEKEVAIGGLPVGINGRVLHLTSGGIDSPVAAFELIKRGIHVDFLAFVTPPQTDELTVDKIKKIITLLSKYQGHSSLYLGKYTILMEALAMMTKQSYKIILMRRSFYRIASTMVERYGYNTFSTGENLGQVASQTLESLTTIQEVTRYPVLRPVLTNDKNDTINLGIKIGTYEISIIPANETCELFAPKKPVIKPTIETAKYCEEEYPDILELEDKLINKINIIKMN